MVEEVADVHHALGVVQRLPVDRQARVAGGAEGAPELAEAPFDRDGDDVGAGHHDVVDADAVEAEHVLQHRPFLGREVRVGRRLGERVLQVVADRVATSQAHEVEKAVVPGLASALPRTGRGMGLAATSIIVHRGSGRLSRQAKASGP